MDGDIPMEAKNELSASGLIYKEAEGRRLSLIFLPPLNKLYDRAPVYLIIPGGGWHEESKESMLEFSAASVMSLRKKGFAAVSIDYRVSSESGVGIEEIISDCFDAARYLSHNREKLEIDTFRIAVSGHSAGGHLALMLAYAPQDIFRKGSVLTDRFKVIVAAPLSAPTILYDKDMEQTLNIDTGHVLKNEKNGYLSVKASPYTYVTSESPATILCAGTSDRLVFSNSSELLYKKLSDYGVKCRLVLSKCGGHCFEQMHESIKPDPSHEDIQKLISDFIIENIYKEVRYGKD